MHNSVRVEMHNSVRVVLGARCTQCQMLTELH